MDSDQTIEAQSVEDCLINKEKRDDLSMFTNLEQKLRRTAIVGVLALLAGFVMGCQELKRTEIEIGRNTLEMQQKMQTQRLEAASARQREMLEARKTREAERRYHCLLGSNRHCY